MGMRDTILGLLAKEPVHGYEMRTRLMRALGPAGGALNPGQVYVTLSRLEHAGLVRGAEIEQTAHPDKKVYELTASGRERVEEWLADVTWSNSPVIVVFPAGACARTGGASIATVTKAKTAMTRNFLITASSVVVSSVSFLPLTSTDITNSYKTHCGQHGPCIPRNGLRSSQKTEIPWAL